MKSLLKRTFQCFCALLLISGGLIFPNAMPDVDAARQPRTHQVKRAHRSRQPNYKRVNPVNTQDKATYHHRASHQHPRNHRRITSRFLNYRFVTQKGRGNANDGCEAASLLMALHHFGLAKHKNLRRFVHTIPRSRNPEKGYTGNPYRLGTGASLYPRALLRVAKRYGAKRSYIIDDYYPYLHHRRRGKWLYRRKAPARAFINAILKGYPVVFEGGNRMQYGGHTHRWGHRGYRSDHVLLLYGYKHHRFYWTDPDHRRNRPGSTRVRLFMYIINAPVRGPRAVAISR